MTAQGQKINIYNTKGEQVKQISLNPEIFGVKINPTLIHQVLVAQQNNSRHNLAHAKGWGEVRGGGAKPWRQKGTGRARHGSNRSPLWVGGVVTFGPNKNRNYSQKVNKKMKQKTVLMGLSDKVNHQNLQILDKLEIKEAKTKHIIEIIENLNKQEIITLKEKKVAIKTPEKNKTTKKSTKFDIKKYKPSILFCIEQSNSNLIRATKNLTGIKIDLAHNLNIKDLLKYNQIILTEKAIQKLEERFLKKQTDNK